jgi:adiponectin receptor
MNPVSTRRRLTPATQAAGQTRQTRQSAAPRRSLMSERRLLRWDELPAWRQEDNSLVETGYRLTTPSVLKCVKSWSYLHNETGATLPHGCPIIQADYWFK